eukprot:4673868-Amphidinium_carterae.1
MREIVLCCQQLPHALNRVLMNVSASWSTFAMQCVPYQRRHVVKDIVLAAGLGSFSALEFAANDLWQEQQQQQPLSDSGSLNMSSATDWGQDMEFFQSVEHMYIEKFEKPLPKRVAELWEPSLA